MEMVKFTIYGEPQGKGRPRFARMGNTVRTYTPKATASYENLVKLSYIQENREKKITGAIRAIIIGVFAIPQSRNKKERAAMAAGQIHHTKKIDCDNLAKTILDALNGIAYDDDKQVCQLVVQKQYGDIPRVEVTLESIAER